MRLNYIIPDTAMKKLQSGGIVDRVNKARNNYDISLIGMVTARDVVGITNEMKEEGVFDYFPKEIKGNFQEKINDVFKNPENHFWTARHLDGEEGKEKAELEDVVSMMGWWSSQILSPEEVFDYQKYGFANVTDFTGAVNALVENKLHEDFRKGYQWTYTDNEGRKFTNEITGDMNCDLRIYRTDITPYDTTDPVGNTVSARPEMRADQSGIYAYHSTEASLLAATLKWVDQTGIPAKSLENSAKETIEWVESLGQGGGTCAEHFFGASNDLMTIMAYSPGVPLQRLDEEDQSEHGSPNCIRQPSHNYYGTYIGSNNELVIASEPRGQKSPLKKDAKLKFMPEEADHVVKGLLYQSAKGLGRTSSAQLVAMLNYRFSPEYEEDVAKSY